MNDCPTGSTLDQIVAEMRRIREETTAVLSLLNELATWFAVFRCTHKIKQGDLLIMNKGLYDQLPFKPAWIKPSEQLPDGGPAVYILRRSATWQ
jgi:hypothetical protein